MLKLNSEARYIRLNSRVVVGGGSPRPGECHIPLGIADIRVAAQFVVHFLTTIIAINAVDNKIAKLHFDGLPAADATGGRRHQRTVECDVIFRRQHSPATSAQ